MPTPKLKVNDHLVGLNQVEQFLFEPKNPNLLEFAVTGHSLGVQVCLITENCESKIGPFVEKLSNEMLGKKWILFVGDNESKDATFEKVKGLKCSAESVVPLRFSKSECSITTYQRLAKVADIYSKEYSHRLIFELVERDEPLQDVQSFCCVATVEMKEEALIMLESLRKFYEKPVYILCDDSSKSYLSSKGISNLKFKVAANPVDLKKIKEELKGKIKERNKFHRPECILKKMDVMDWALEENENTFFLDTDIIIVGHIGDALSRDIILSPHYDISGRATNGLYYGYFNAGYIFCADKSFPEQWRKLYLNRSDFYEQEGMNYLSEKYDIGIFGREHNIGFWRDTKLPIMKDGAMSHPDGFRIDLPDEIKSFHAHLSPYLNFGPHVALEEKNRDMRKMVMGYLEQSAPELFSFITKVFDG